MSGGDRLKEQSDVESKDHQRGDLCWVAGQPGGDVEFLGELVEAYLAESPGLFASMRQGIASGDGPTLQRAAHSLKSGSAGFGALAFAAQCKELEEMGKMGVLDGARLKYEALEAAYGGVVAALEGRMQSARSAST